MKIIVAVTGASGSVYAQLLFDRLHALRAQIEEVAVIFSDTAKQVWSYELQAQPRLYDFIEYQNTDFFAPVASGSSRYDVCFVCPCSVGTMGRIAHGTADSLITRAADVMLKERRRVILTVRETPYSLIHIKNMELLTQAGAIICPATPSFYSRPTSIESLCGTVIDRMIDLAGLSQTCYRWESR